MSFKYSPQVDYITQKINELRKDLISLTIKINSLDYLVQNHHENITNENDENTIIGKINGVDAKVNALDSTVLGKINELEGNLDELDTTVNGKINELQSNIGNTIFECYEPKGEKVKANLNNEVNLVNFDKYFSKIQLGYNIPQEKIIDNKSSNTEISGNIKIDTCNPINISRRVKIDTDPSTFPTLNSSIHLVKNGMLISPTPDLEDNSHCIGLTYGLKFLVDNLENPTKLIIRKPGVLSNSVLNNNDIILNFGSYYSNGVLLSLNEIFAGLVNTSVVGLGGDFEKEKQKEKQERGLENEEAEENNTTQESFYNIILYYKFKNRCF
jgi:hypothetical protein